jgi:hypothetical protein
MANDHPSTWQEPDGLLATLVSMANKGTASFDMTFLCNGMILAGTIVGGNHYLDALGKAISTGIERTSPNIPKKELVSLSEYFTKLGEKIYPSGDKESGGGERLEKTFVHLKDVTVIAPQDWSSQSEFPYWRLQLASVDAWTLGRPRSK